MLLYATYCSRDKSAVPGTLPAIERYRSERIQAVFEAASAAGAGFRILSGRFGLLEATSEIPLYDHLLTAEEVAEMTKKVAGQLRQLEPGQVVFFSRTVQEDPRVAPYRATIMAACKRLGIAITMVDMTGKVTPPVDNLSIRDTTVGESTESD